MAREVIGYGPENAKIMIVMDYPSKDELAMGKAGAGANGNLIGSLLRNNGARLSDCYITSYIRTEFHLPKGKADIEKALQEVKESYKPRSFGQVLSNEIAEINPNVVVACGEFAFRYLTGKRSVLNYRGSILPISDICRLDALNKIKPVVRVIGVIHPRDIHAKWTHYSYSQFDWSKIVSNQHRTDPIREPGISWICRTATEINNWWERAKHGDFLTLDIETYAGFITCIGFSHDGNEGICIPLIEKPVSLLDRALVLRKLSEILKSPIPKVNQNIKYDHHMLEYWGFQLGNVAGDTMLLGHTIYPELPKSLAFYTSIYTDFSYYKDDGREFNPKEGWDKLFYYNAKDAITAWQIYKKQVEDARESGVYNFYQTKVWPCYAVYKKMDDRGIQIDGTQRRILLEKYNTALAVHLDNLRCYTGKPDINFNSPKQISAIVYDELKLPPQYKLNKQTGKKGLSTDEETLEELILNFGISEEAKQILWEVIWCRKLYKILGYINTPIHLDGRMHTWSKLTGTKSGRTSMGETVDCHYYADGRKTLYEPRGLSFQTIPKHGFEVGTARIGDDIRSMYIPSPGRVLVEGDQGQAEARVVCVLAEDWSALKEMERTTFERNKHKIKDDLHTKTAMLVLGKSFQDITESDRQDFGKKPRHAGNYDMGAGRLSLLAHISENRAQQVLTSFHKESPNIRGVFHAGVRNKLENCRVLETPHGRIRQFFGKMINETFKEAYSFIPQAVVSDHSKFDTLLPLEEETRSYADFLSESHDSLTFEVDKSEAERFCARFKYYEEQPIDFRNGSFHRDVNLVIPLEIKIGEYNWHEMKEIKIK